MSSLTLLWIAVASAGAEAVEQSNPLLEYAEDFRGTWVSEWTADESSPGVKVGDKFEFEMTIEWALNQAILVCDVTEQKAGREARDKMKGIVAWDPVKERPTMHLWNTRGSVIQQTYDKKENTWIVEGKKIDREGKESSANFIIELAEGAQVHRESKDSRQPDLIWIRK